MTTSSVPAASPPAKRQRRNGHNGGGCSSSGWVKSGACDFNSSTLFLPHAYPIPRCIVIGHFPRLYASPTLPFFLHATLLLYCSFVSPHEHSSPRILPLTSTPYSFVHLLLFLRLPPSPSPGGVLLVTPIPAPPPATSTTNTTSFIICRQPIFFVRSCYLRTIGVCLFPLLPLTFPQKYRHPASCLVLLRAWPVGLFLLFSFL